MRLCAGKRNAASRTSNRSRETKQLKPETPTANKCAFLTKESQDIRISENELEWLAGSYKSSTPGCRRASDGTESSSNLQFFKRLSLQIETVKEEKEEAWIN